MKKKLLIVVSYILVAAIACCATFLLSRNWQLIAPDNKLTQLQALLEQYYADDVDLDALQDAAANAMVEALPDRWSYYISARDYAAYEENKNNAYVGVGVTVIFVEKGCEITKISKGGPAEEAGLLPGDLIIAVDGTLLQGVDSDTAKQLIQGEEGTTVDLTVQRGEATQTFRVERRTVQTQVAEAVMIDGNIGLVTIHNFNTNCAKESIAAVDQLLEQGAVALIFDVRNNGGGYTKELVKLLDYLLPEGPLFRSEDYAGKQSVDYSDAACVDVPMAVLVNGSSYSAAEFFAAALWEYDAAVVVGEQTSGKGFYQVTYRLKDGSAVALSTGKYFTPNGNSLEGIGLTPEVYVAVDDGTASAIYAGTLPPMEDPQILAAIAALQQS